MAAIVIVEQSPFMRGSLKFIAETAGHKIVGDTNNSAEAMELCGRLAPDIIIMDVAICGAGTFALMKTIRIINPTAKVIVTSMPSARDKAEDALRHGACGHIEKPYKYEDIASEITRVLKLTLS